MSNEQSTNSGLLAGEKSGGMIFIVLFVLSLLAHLFVGPRAKAR